MFVPFLRMLLVKFLFLWWLVKFRILNSACVEAILITLNYSTIWLDIINFALQIEDLRTKVRERRESRRKENAGRSDFKTLKDLADYLVQQDNKKVVEEKEKMLRNLDIKWHNSVWIILYGFEKCDTWWLTARYQKGCMDTRRPCLSITWFSNTCYNTVGLLQYQSGHMIM